MIFFFSWSLPSIWNQYIYYKVVMQWTASLFIGLLQILLPSPSPRARSGGGNAGFCWAVCQCSVCGACRGAGLPPPSPGERHGGRRAPFLCMWMPVLRWHKSTGVPPGILRDEALSIHLRADSSTDAFPFLFFMDFNVRSASGSQLESRWFTGSKATTNILIAQHSFKIFFFSHVFKKII